MSSIGVRWMHADGARRTPHAAGFLENVAVLLGPTLMARASRTPQGQGKLPTRGVPGDTQTRLPRPATALWPGQMAREYFVGRYASLALIWKTKLGKMPNKETIGWFCVGWGGDVDGLHSSN